MALFPKRVDIDNASVQRLKQLFTDSTNDLQQYLFTLNGRNISRGNIIQVRALIQQRLQKLGVDVGNWISTEVPRQYIQGQQDAAKQQSSFGNHAGAAAIVSLIAHVSAQTKTPAPDIVTDTPAAIAEAPKIISPVQKAFELQTKSVQSIVDSMSTSFTQSLAAMDRSANKIITSAQRLEIRRQIAEEASRGADTSKISSQISDLLSEEDISALTDAAGREWLPENYADMLVNTELAHARNEGMMNAQTSIGEDLVEVSSHGATDACEDWEGEILSISGNDPTYPSVDDATSAGLFHPRCQHSLNAVDSADYPSTVSPDSLDMADLVAAL